MRKGCRLVAPSPCPACITSPWRGAGCLSVEGARLGLVLGGAVSPSYKRRTAEEEEKGSLLLAGSRSRVWSRAGAMREIVHIQAGQCGNQIGAKVQHWGQGRVSKGCHHCALGSSLPHALGDQVSSFSSFSALCPGKQSYFPS